VGELVTKIEKIFSAALMFRSAGCEVAKVKRKVLAEKGERNNLQTSLTRLVILNEVKDLQNTRFSDVPLKWMSCSSFTSFRMTIFQRRAHVSFGWLRGSKSRKKFHRRDAEAQSCHSKNFSASPRLCGRVTLLLAATYFSNDILKMKKIPRHGFMKNTWLAELPLAK
jgi:hypothetical protein